MSIFNNTRVVNTGEPDQSDLALAEVDKPKAKRPPLYRVILLNDDYTPMEFVVAILMDIFGMNEEAAVQVMLHVHEKGIGICGVFTREVAETKVETVMNTAISNQHPLQCTMEPDDSNEEDE